MKQLEEEKRKINIGLHETALVEHGERMAFAAT